MSRKRVNITLKDETRERLLQYSSENRLQGGISGAIEHIVWNVLKVHNMEFWFNEHKKAVENWIYGDPVRCWINENSYVCVMYSSGIWFHYDIKDNEVVWW